jgi:hypothetical protein
MKEYKSIEVMNNVEIHLHQDSRLCNQSRMSNEKDACNDRNNAWKWLQLMKEYKSTSTNEPFGRRQDDRGTERWPLAHQHKPVMLGILVLFPMAKNGSFSRRARSANPFV